LTYQVVPAFDEHEKVLAGWEGEKLRYMVVVEKLPPQWRDADQYFQGFIADLQATGRAVRTARSGSYRSTSGMSGRYLELRHGPARGATPVMQTLHFITDGKQAFLGVATAVDLNAADRTLAETQLLFQSASVAADASQADRQRAESAFIGDWASSATAPDGRSVQCQLALKDDLSFTTVITIEGHVVFTGAGTWSVDGRSISWTYMRSVPPLPEDKREDHDEVVSIDDSRLVLLSGLSGVERVFLRQ
jgi:hypothetical protein